MDIENKIKVLLIQALELSVLPEDIESDVSLFEGIGLDSVSTLEIVVGLEDEFGFEVDDDELTEDIFESVNSLRHFVINKLDES